jgi:hypothetical protein
MCLLLLWLRECSLASSSWAHTVAWRDHELVTSSVDSQGRTCLRTTPEAGLLHCVATPGRWEMDTVQPVIILPLPSWFLSPLEGLGWWEEKTHTGNNQRASLGQGHQISGTRLLYLLRKAHLSCFLASGKGSSWGLEVTEESQIRWGMIVHTQEDNWPNKHVPWQRLHLTQSLSLISLPLILVRTCFEILHIMNPQKLQVVGRCHRRACLFWRVISGHVIRLDHQGPE